MFEIWLNNKKGASYENKTPRKYENVKVFGGDPWYPAASAPTGGWLRKLEVASGGYTNIQNRLYPGK